VTAVLVVEDDTETRELLAEALEAEGYRVLPVGRAAAATAALQREDVAAVVLDVWLPDGNGFALCRDWRRSGIRVPVLILTARSDVSSRVEGLDAGADDYLCKPFALSELRARLRALLRRRAVPEAARILERGGLRVDFDRRQAWQRGVEVPLTRRELEVLDRLFLAGGRAVSRDTLLEDVWGDATPENAASLEVIVARLRRKLDDRPSLIRTLRGHGYALAAEGQEPE